MNGISSRKLTWGICIAGIAIAIISFFFLPEIIPVHFAGDGAADDFGNKIEIFLMPILLLAVTILSGQRLIFTVTMLLFHLFTQVLLFFTTFCAFHFQSLFSLYSSSHLDKRSINHKNFYLITKVICDSIPSKVNGNNLR